MAGELMMNRSRALSVVAPRLFSPGSAHYRRFLFVDGV